MKKYLICIREVIKRIKTRYLIFGATALVVLLFFFAYGPSKLVEWTSISEFCNSCHVMNEQYESWFMTGLHRSIKCVDCHLPNDNPVNHLVWKGLDGMKDVILFYGRMYSENPPPAPGILQLLNNIEHKIFDPLPLGGKSWIPETAVKEKGEYIYEVDLEDDGSALEMEGFAEMIRENRHSDVLLREAYYAAIASVLGNESIKKGEVLTFPEEYIL